MTEKANLSKTKVDMPKNEKSIVSKEELDYIKYDIRARLIIANVSKAVFMDNMLKNFNDSEKISIKELAKELSMKSLELSNEHSELLARYIIEPRDSPIIEFTIYRDEETKSVKNKLEKTLAIPYNISKDIDPEFNALTKIRSKKTALLDKLRNKGDLRVWIAVFADVVRELEPIDIDVLIAIGFEKSKNIRKLSFDV